jgi:hypothetical protein
VVISRRGVCGFICKRFFVKLAGVTDPLLFRTHACLISGGTEDESGYSPRTRSVGTGGQLRLTAARTMHTAVDRIFEVFRVWLLVLV